jgi:hypothetical protein
MGRLWGREADCRDLRGVDEVAFIEGQYLDFPLTGIPGELATGLAGKEGEAVR